MITTAKYEFRPFTEILPASPEVFTYDLDGNLTRDGRFTYTWDAENRLTTMETLATVPFGAKRKLAFVYDGMGRRIRKTTWLPKTGGGWQLHTEIKFLHELGGWNVQAETNSAGEILQSYVWGSDLSGSLGGAGGVGGLLFTTSNPDNSTHAYASDLNGNVSLLVNTNTGQSSASYEYGPFGEPLRESGFYAKLNPFRFSSKYFDDETGLVDYGLRYYRVVDGRWISRDPIEERGGVNLYGFLKNDGVNHWDYLGLIDPNTDSWHHIYSQSVFTENFIKKHCLDLKINSPENGWIMIWKDHSHVDHRLGWTREWKAWVTENDNGPGSITLEMVKKQKESMFSKYELGSVGYQANVSYKKGGQWKALLKDGISKKQSASVIIGMLYVAASLNEVDANDMSKISNLAVDVRGASDFSEEFSAKLELIELITINSGMPESAVALWVDNYVKINN